MCGTLTWEKTSEAMNLLIKEQSYSALLGLGWELVASFFIGGALLTAVMTPLTYFGVKKLVLLFRERQNKKIEKRGNFKSHSKNDKDAIRKEL